MVISGAGVRSERTGSEDVPIATKRRQVLNNNRATHHSWKSRHESI